MSKWSHVPDKRKKEIYAYNARKAQDAEAAADLQVLLGALPPGQVKQLLKDETCGAILAKYGVTAE